MFVKAPISNSTIGNILRRMIKKRIIVEKHPGVYVSNVKDFNVLLSRIDLSRIKLKLMRKGEYAENLKGARRR